MIDYGKFKMENRMVGPNNFLFFFSWSIHRNWSLKVISNFLLIIHGKWSTESREIITNQSAPLPLKTNILITFNWIQCKKYWIHPLPWLLMPSKVKLVYFLFNNWYFSWINSWKIYSKKYSLFLLSKPLFMHFSWKNQSYSPFISYIYIPISVLKRKNHRWSYLFLFSSYILGPTASLLLLNCIRENLQIDYKKNRTQTFHDIRISH